ncbi:MAG: hypothetical protein ACE5I3_05775 [Phycisphaerae bacterium]
MHDVAGVASLQDLSVTEAARLIDRLQAKAYEHRKDWTPREPDRAKARGVIRNATQRQRADIARLLEQLGWDPAKSVAWLRQRHGIRSLAGGVFTSRTASEAIYQLEQALEKRRARNRVLSRPRTVVKPGLSRIEGAE